MTAVVRLDEAEVHTASPGGKTCSATSMTVLLAATAVVAEPCQPRI